MSDYPGAIQLLNGNCFPGRNGLKPRWLILHGTAGGTSAREIAQYFKGTQGSNNPVSATYVVDQEAEIYQCNLESDGPFSNGVVTAGHDPWWNADGNPNPNDVCISIEFVKPDTANATALTVAQMAAGLGLIADICKRNNIPARPADASGGITSHASIDPINRSRCPGTFDWNVLWTYLANGGNTPMGVPQGWSDDGHTLKAPNGIPVVLGFRDHILADPTWSPNNWPLEAEHHVSPIEQSHPSLGGGQVQLFRWKRLEYTAAGGIIEGWLGQELFWYQNQYVATQAQITKLQTQISLLQSQVADLQNQLDASVQAQTITALQDKIEQAVKDLS